MKLITQNSISHIYVIDHMFKVYMTDFFLFARSILRDMLIST